MTINMRIIERPAFTIAGQQTWIDGPDNEPFGRFWDTCRASGLLDRLHQLRQASGHPAGPHTQGALLGVSRVEQDPSNRAFHYMIAIEVPESLPTPGLERYTVPASEWAVFECHGPFPDSIVASEMYAFMEWLPNSAYQHALAPEMEVYPASGGDTYCEFWLPLRRKEG